MTDEINEMSNPKKPKYVVLSSVIGALCFLGALFFWSDNNQYWQNNSDLVHLQPSFFFESVDESSRRPLGSLENINQYLTVPSIETDRIDLDHSRLFDAEIEGSLPFRDIIWSGYFWFDDDDNLKVVRDSHQRLRSPPYSQEISGAPLVEGQLYRDHFRNAVPKRGAKSFAPYYQALYPIIGGRIKTNRIEYFGKDIVRSKLENEKASTSRTRWVCCDNDNSDADAWLYELNFGTLEAEQIASRGASFEISDVAEIFRATTAHRLQSFETSTKMTIGSMAPNAMGYRTNDGIYKTLTFIGADITEFDFDVDSGVLSIDVYDYHFEERAVFGTTTDPDADGMRVHPNLAIASAIPSASIKIIHSVSDVIAFPSPHPDGRLASLVISEHADYVGVGVDNVSMYGNLDGARRDGEGIVGNDIPVTKTIFPTFKSDVGIPLVDKKTGKSHSFERSSFLKSPDLRLQIEGYRTNGADVEIGVHCAGSTDNIEEKTRHRITELLAPLSQHKPVTWIDHGGPECLWEQGWDPKSNFYIMDTLQKHGFKYLNPLLDKFVAMENLIFDDAPNNILFYLPAYDPDWTDDWVPWTYSTQSVTFSSSTFTADQLAGLIELRAYVNLHSYLSYNLLEVGRNEDGEAIPVLQPWANETLRKLRELSDAKLLHLSTNEDMLDHLLRVREIGVFYAGAQIALERQIKSGKRMPDETTDAITFVSIPLSENADARMREEFSGSREAVDASGGTRFIRDGAFYEVAIDFSKLRTASHVNDQ